jgi:hypothetical protein
MDKLMERENEIESIVEGRGNGNYHGRCGGIFKAGR